MHPKDLPDLVHIEAIRRALWRPRGGAALMVGSGFSHNARPVSGAVGKMLLWSELTRELYCDLHPGHSRDAKLPPGTSSLQLAEEYQRTFGPTRLDERLRQLLPDDRYEPGPLHKLLLDLPWRDVFTTNYDRLLERTQLAPVSTYHLVFTPSDIPQSRPPRLVKLHGSFPAQRPFILTEEEYRRYPREFGPFVNLVQQAIMEHTFCLLGFSGEDPNFLAWAGWVRDHLGSAAPPIYLCGVLDCTASKRRYFESKNVIPVDLGPLFPRDEEFREQRHERALEWFLLSLYRGKPVDRSPWPSVEVPQLPREPSNGLPPLLKPPEVPEILKPPPEPSYEMPIDVDWAQKLLKSWRSQRKAYPGWVLCPERNRKSLEWRTSLMLGFRGDQFVQIIANDPLPEQLQALHEIVWHLRRLLLPLSPSLVTRIETVLESINPHPRYIDLPAATLHRDHPGEGAPSLDWDTLLHAWIELGLVLVNDAWHDWNWEHFDDWMKRLERVVRLRPEWHAAWCFERCWRALMHLDAEATREALGGWPTKPECPFWEAKRASVLAELGESQEAERIAQEALAAVRAGADNEGIDYRSRSEEGWVLFLCRQLRLRSNDRNQARELERQLRQLREARCDPLENLRELNDQLRQQDRPPGRYEIEERSFDPGRVTRSVRWRSSDLFEWPWIQTYHDAPLLLPDGPEPAVLETLIKMLWPSSPLLAAAFHLRSGGGKELEKNAFGRADVASFPEDVVQNLCVWLIPALRRAITSSSFSGEKGHRDLLSKRAFGGVELLSRLTFRMSREQRSETLELALDTYRSGRARRHLSLPDPLNNLFRRLAFAASEEEFFSSLPLFLSLPLPGEAGFAVDAQSSWYPDPLEACFTGRSLRAATETERGSWTRRVDELIALAQEARPEVREKAILRLALLTGVHGLTEKQVARFLGALWKETEETGLPAHTNLLPWVFLALPERQRGDNERAVRVHLLKRNIPSLRDGESEHRGIGSDRIKEVHYAFQSLIHCSLTVWPVRRGQEWHRLEWSSEEAAVLLGKLESWWRKSSDDVIWLHDRDDSFSASIESIVATLLAIVAVALLPRLDEQPRQAAARLIQSIQKEGFSLLEFLPALLALLGISSDEAARQIRHDLLGSTDDEERNAANAIRLWHLLARDGRTPEPPAFLLDDLIAQVASRRQPGLEIALTFARLFLEEIPDRLSDVHMEAMCRGIEHLSIETLPPSGGTPGDMKGKTKLVSPFSSEERIALRAETSALAASLQQEYARRGMPIPASIEWWKQVAAMDMLPEVRRPWMTAGLSRGDGSSSR
jgi:hypothetical protein